MSAQNQHTQDRQVYNEIQAIQKLLAEVIRQAVEDYRHFERKGIIQRGKVVSGEYDRHVAGWAAISPERFQSRRHAIGRGMSRGEAEARELVEFFKRHVDDLIDVGYLALNPNSGSGLL